MICLSDDGVRICVDRSKRSARAPEAWECRSRDRTGCIHGLVGRRVRTICLYYAGAPAGEKLGSAVDSASRPWTPLVMSDALTLSMPRTKLTLIRCHCLPPAAQVQPLEEFFRGVPASSALSVLTDNTRATSTDPGPLVHLHQTIVSYMDALKKGSQADGRSLVEPNISLFKALRICRTLETLTRFLR